MRCTGWMAGFVIAAVCGTGALAADYAGPYRHHRAGYGPRGFIGECLRTRVRAMGAPAGAATAGPVIVYNDGVVQAFDDGMLGHTETRPGDPIQLCLVSFSRDCGDQELPGRTYATGNLRTGAAWTLPDVRSSCQAR